MPVKHISKVSKVSPRNGDYFGGTSNLSYDGSVLICIAPYFDNIHYGIGTVTIFNLVNGSYVLKQELTPPVGITSTDHYSLYAQINDTNDMIMLCAPEYDQTSTLLGAILIYRLVSGTWVFDKYIRETSGLPPVFPPQKNKFGFQFHLSKNGNTLLVTAPFDDNDGVDSGVVYIYETIDDWVTFSSNRITSNSPSIGNYFGLNCMLSYDGNVAIIGSFRGTLGNGDGRAEIHYKSGGSWIFAHYIEADVPQVNSFFSVSNPSLSLIKDFTGVSISCSSDGNIICVCADNYDSNGSVNGSAFVYTRNGNTWTQIQRLDATTSQSFVFFGYACSFSASGRFLVVGAQVENVEIYIYQGVNYLYEFDGSSYVLIDKIWAPYLQSSSYGAFKPNISGNSKYLASGSIEDVVSGVPFSGAVNVWEIESLLLSNRSGKELAIAPESEVIFKATDDELNNIKHPVNTKWKWYLKEVQNTTQNIKIISQGAYTFDVWKDELGSVTNTPI